MVFFDIDPRSTDNVSIRLVQLAALYQHHIFTLSSCIQSSSSCLASPHLAFCCFWEEYDHIDLSYGLIVLFVPSCLLP